jgi:hypothetical protein
MDQTVQTATVTPFSRINKIGLGIAGVLGLLDIVSVLEPNPGGDGAQSGPPDAIIWLDGLLGLITVVAVVIAWRTGRRGFVRLAAGARIISALTALPAFFVDVPAWLKVLVGVFGVLTVVCVVMMLTPAARTSPVTD